MTRDMFDISWDIEKYKSEHESEDHWSLRRQFMVAHKHKFPESRLVCLAQVFFNMEFLGCRYPSKTMNLVNQLAAEVAEEFRESRKNKLKRTFVGAQDAAGAKAKGAKPPPGATEKSEDQGNIPKKPRLEEDQTKQCESIMIEDEESDSLSGTEMPAANSNNKDHTPNLREVSKTFTLLIPPRTNSKTEKDPVCLMHLNFPGKKMSFRFSGSREEGGWTCEVWVNPLPYSNDKPTYLIASFFASSQRKGKQEAAAQAVEGLMKFCTYLEPNPEWFKEGKTPEFIEKGIPCTKTPRSYLILSKKETGHISPEVADILVSNFMMSSNDDMFFPDKEYTEKEKVNLMNFSQKHKVGFRHFGNKIQLKDHHVCIYKIKSADEILEEARMMNWKHPKYVVNLKTPETSASSPPKTDWDKK